MCKGAGGVNHNTIMTASTLLFCMKQNPIHYPSEERLPTSNCNPTMNAPLPLNQCT